MKSQYRALFAFVALLMSASLACGALSPSQPAAVPTNPPPPTNAPLPTSDAALPNPGGPSNPAGGNTGNSTTGTSSDIVTFVDQNNLLAFDLPGNWTFEHTELGDSVYSDADAYSDLFTSPDGSANMESLVIFASTSLDNSTSAAAALDLLHRFYSSTGNVGDIRISSDQIMKDGSERFEWTSKGGGYSGITFFEVRGDNRKTWLMLTTWYSNDADQSTLDAINNAINTYYIP